ncbi:unnamed protein product [Didymodactylos carnosus]|uniref:Protein CLEC16A n=1 Tax=Didymodactylos carnosus TaxID=1234261 RepID=A0A814LP47_9BILA|nr:unnamed protein product [Didymodactylos carnosus]CAF3835190.1 unnamed protein product [Didymodactylos carnosus]
MFRRFIHCIYNQKTFSLYFVRYLYDLLQRNQTVSDTNRDLLIDTLWRISEILIWGDQNDSSVFDFFLEKGMLNYFLNYMRQKHGRYICVQLLQTLNILFENIRHETSLYYLLSNNHINNIIMHKFDFADEEITAYYISFLKTLSLKLNTSSINFFYNERNNDFPLYVEAIKFFNHPETMIRIAVRTLTLNVYKVPDHAMHRFILDRTATQYFSNFVWFIRNHIIDFDNLIRNNRDVNNRGYLTCGLEEYLDHLHYLQDIFLLNVDSLNVVLKNQLMNRLLIPVYVFSLIKRDKFCSLKDPRVTIDQTLAFFLLADIFLVIQYMPIVEQLASIILSADIETVEAIQRRFGEQVVYTTPPVPLDVCLTQSDSKEKLSRQSPADGVLLNVVDIDNNNILRCSENDKNTSTNFSPSPPLSSSSSSISRDHSPQKLSTSLTPSSNSSVTPKTESLFVSNWTDDEKCKRQLTRTSFNDLQLAQRPYFEALINALNCIDNDQQCFYALSLIYTMCNNPFVDSIILESVGLTMKSKEKQFYNSIIMDQLCEILKLSTMPDSKIRLVTLDLTIKILKNFVYDEQKCTSSLSDHHLACVEQAHEQATEDLRRHYKHQEMFLDLFEDEYRQIQINPIRLEYVLKDACMLLPPTTTPLSGIEFTKRLPSGDIERARRSIRIFFLLRSLSLDLSLTTETLLPLVRQESLVKENDVLDLNNSDLIACTVHMKDKKDRRFLVTDPLQFILIEPDIKRLGWGIVKFCDLMQDVEVTGDKEDSRSLHITIHKPANNVYVKSNPSALNAKFTFDDHIRCMTAKQNLTKGRQRARATKMQTIAQILEIPDLSPNINQSFLNPAMGATFSQTMLGFPSSSLTGQPGLFNHPGRAALISGPKSQPVTTNSLSTSRSIASSTNTSSSPVLSQITSRRYSLSRAISEQSNSTENRKFTDNEITNYNNHNTSRKTSLTVYGDGSQSQAHKNLDDLPSETSSSSRSNTIKSLIPAQEAPVNLLEQPNIKEKAMVQILSPQYERVSKSC